MSNSNSGPLPREMVRPVALFSQDTARSPFSKSRWKTKNGEHSCSFFSLLDDATGDFGSMSWRRPDAPSGEEGRTEDNQRSKFGGH